MRLVPFVPLFSAMSTHSFYYLVMMCACQFGRLFGEYWAKINALGNSCKERLSKQSTLKSSCWVSERIEKAYTAMCIDDSTRLMDGRYFWMHECPTLWTTHAFSSTDSDLEVYHHVKHLLYMVCSIGMMICDILLDKVLS